MKLTSASIGVGAMAVALSMCSGAGDTPASSTSPSGQSTSSSSPPDHPGNAVYRDGEYSARGSYGSLPSHQDVTLTIRDASVVSVEITTPAEDDTSLGYQKRFAAALPKAVVGRNIADLTVDRLAGSSGCSEGFMNALAEIKNAAAE